MNVIKYPIGGTEFYNRFTYEGKHHDGWYYGDYMLDPHDISNHIAIKYPGCGPLTCSGSINGMTFYVNDEIFRSFPISSFNEPICEHFINFKQQQEQYQTRGPVINPEKIGCQYINTIGVESLYNFGQPIKQIFLNGLADYIILAWSTHGQLVIDPTIVINSILSMMTNMIDKMNLQGIFSGTSERQDVGIPVSETERFPWGDFISAINQKLTDHARQILEPIDGMIESINQSGHPLIAGALATQLIGAMKRDFRLVTYRCAMTGILINKDDPLWINVLDTLRRIPSLIPDLDHYCSVMTETLTRWLHEDFTHCLFSVKGCFSGHDEVSGDLVFMLTGEWSKTKEEFLTANCYGYVHWSNLETSRQFIGVSGMSQCDIFPVVIGDRRYHIISPCWSFSKYFHSSNHDTVPDHKMTNCPSYVGQWF